MTWEQLEKEYNIKFRLENGEFRPVNEWLDDLYLRLSYREAERLIMVIMRNGESLFKDILFHHLSEY
jgi:hypothetical protein